MLPLSPILWAALWVAVPSMWLAKANSFLTDIQDSWYQEVSHFTFLFWFQSSLNMHSAPSYLTQAPPPPPPPPPLPHPVWVIHYLAVLLPAGYNSWINLSHTHVQCHPWWAVLSHNSWKEKVELHRATKNHIGISEYWGPAKILIVMNLNLKHKAIIAQILPLSSCHFC